MSKKGITQEDVEKALQHLEDGLDLSKASEQDLDQPEGSDFDGKNTNMKGKKKLSDEAPGPDKSPKGAKKSFASDEDAEEINKAKACKADGEEYDEDEEGEDMEKTNKSFAESLPDEVQTKIDVSDFLRSLVDHTGEAIDNLRSGMTKSMAASEDRVSELFGAVEDIQKSQAQIGVVLKAICEQIGVVGNSPAQAEKADTVAKSNGVAERNFSNSVADEGSDDEPMFKSLSPNPAIAKSQLSSALCDLVKSGKATDMDVIGFESGGYIRPELVQELKATLN